MSYMQIKNIYNNCEVFSRKFMISEVIGQEMCHEILAAFGHGKRDFQGWKDQCKKSRVNQDQVIVMRKKKYM